MAELDSRNQLVKKLTANKEKQAYVPFNFIH